MHSGCNQEITPWQNDPHYNIFTIQYDQPTHKSMKKFSSKIDSRKVSLRSKQKKTLKLRQLAQQPQKQHSMKNYVAQSLSTKSKEQMIMFQSQKVKKETDKLIQERNNKSSIITADKIHSLHTIESDFIIRKYDRMKKLSKSMFREVKMDDIFRKITQIQNPSHRQNISLPKIQIKI